MIRQVREVVLNKIAFAKSLSIISGVLYMVLYLLKEESTWSSS